MLDALARPPRRVAAPLTFIVMLALVASFLPFGTAGRIAAGVGLAAAAALLAATRRERRDRANRVACRRARRRARRSTIDTRRTRLSRLDEIVRQSERKDQFLSEVSHEFRTPLAAIRSFAEILLNYDQEDPDTDREFLGIIHAESGRLARLVDDLLDLSKIEAGRADWRIAPFEATALIQRVVRSLSPLAAERRIDFQLDLADAPIAAEGDVDRIAQVMTNLISNAVKFSPAGGRIVLRARVSDDQWRLDVEDEGDGVPEHEQENVFERFRQVRRANGADAAARGTGLGLPISREIIQRHAGRLWLEANEPRGCRFSFRLPLRRPAAVSIGGS